MATFPISWEGGESEGEGETLVAPLIISKSLGFYLFKLNKWINRVVNRSLKIRYKYLNNK